MDSFSGLDNQEYASAINEAINSAQSRRATEREAQDAQEKKDTEYNEKLQGVLDPITQELLRRPVEKIAKQAFGRVATGIRSRVAGGIRKAGSELKTLTEQKLERAGAKLGVKAKDLASLRGVVPKSYIPKIPDGSPTAGLPADIGDEARQVLGVKKSLPTEVDAFTGKPITRKAPSLSKEFDEATDASHALYDQPIAQVAPKSSVPVPKSGAIPVPEDAPSDIQSASQRLGDIFQDQVKTSDLPTPSFQPTPKSAPTVEGDSQPLDSLAPMRDLMAKNGSSISPAQEIANRSALNSYASSQADAPKPKVLQQEVKPLDEAGDIPTDIGDDASSALKTAGKETAESLGEKVASSFGEAEAVLGGAEDPLADIVGLFAGLGSLFGGVFGAKHHQPVTPPEQPIVNSGVQAGVY